jgi:mono/diheme cytochrome c family protein
MQIRKIGVTALLVLLAAGTAAAGTAADRKELERGHYLLTVAGCNDCHTPGWPESGGKVKPEDWLTGSPVGFSGPWGTTYPANLRRVIGSMNEQAWLKHARTPRRPPMPWFNLASMSDADLKAIYQYVRSLGLKGEPAPDFVGPGQAATTPYIEFFPKNLPTEHARAH